jgi:ABC-2 type transport system ATP-binding protein
MSENFKSKDYQSLSQTSLKVENLVCQVGGKHLISHINLSLQTGKKIALLGLNGAGKSTLLRALIGELKPTNGQIEYFSGHQSLQPYELSFKRRLGYQADTMLAMAELSGVEYLCYCGQFKQLSNKQVHQQLAELARQWHLDEVLTKPLKVLSKGNLQKLAIAQAFLGQPKWLFLDEPCQSLDPAEQIRFNHNIAALKQFELCMVSTHNVEQALEFADEIILLHQGELLYHFKLAASNRYLMVLKKQPPALLAKIVQLFDDNSISIERLSERLIGLSLTEPSDLDKTEKLFQENKSAIEFLLPDQEALVAIFRLLASGELNIQNYSELPSKTAEV